MRWDAIEERAGAFPRIVSAAPVGAGGTVTVGAAAAGSAANAPAASAAPPNRHICLQLIIQLAVSGLEPISS